MSPIRNFGIVGLGKMGADLALNALHHGYGVVGLDTHRVPSDLTGKGLKVAADAKELVALLEPPRFVIVYVPAGPPVDAVLEELADTMQRGDIIADGGNSYWGDSIRRHARLKKQGIHFIDAGTSGGPGGALDGACFMVGGEDEPVAMIEPILLKLAVEGGYVHAGGPGAGHFVKLVHNGIEFAMLEAIGEGIDLLVNYREKLPIDAILKCWRHGSVIRSWLVELMERMYREKGGLAKRALLCRGHRRGELAGRRRLAHGGADPRHHPVGSATARLARQQARLGARHLDDAARLRRPSVRRRRRHRARAPHRPRRRIHRQRAGGEPMTKPIGRTAWAIAEGYIPPASTGATREMTSHETVCILNAADRDAHVEIMVYFADRDPAGPYNFTVGARRTRHLRFNDFKDPQPVPGQHRFFQRHRIRRAHRGAAHAPRQPAGGAGAVVHHGVSHRRMTAAAVL